MALMQRIVWTAIASLAVATAFTTTTAPNNNKHHVRTSLQLGEDGWWNDNVNNVKDKSPSKNQRRELLTSSLMAVVLAASTGLPSASRAAEEDPIPTPVAGGEGVVTYKTAAPTPVTGAEGVIMYKTASGLKYIELEPGNPSSPPMRYGQVCVISYTAFLKLPNSKEPKKFDTSSNFIMKHGNGKMLIGLDEGLHTMKVGGLRRIIIPPKLGFVVSGLGPVPEYPWNRWILNGLLEDMITQRGGNLVYDVRLERVIDDEADQGYYEDGELSAEELAELTNRLVKRDVPLPPSAQE
jgi:hypothetical protein